MNKGFTLIELLAVIIILAIIATITLFTTGNVLQDTKESLSETQKANIIEAAKHYCMLESCEEYVCVKTLIETDYIEAEKVYDPKNREEIKGYVTITENNNKTKYEYSEEDLTLCE